MPNWCHNEVTLYHNDPAMLARAETAIAAGSLLNEFLPMPTELKENDGWYDWRLIHWGTKWDIDGEVVDKKDGSIVLSFESAWSPPIEAYRTMEAEHGFTIYASYEELGIGFRGNYADGEEYTYDIDEAPDDIDEAP